MKHFFHVAVVSTVLGTACCAFAGSDWHQWHGPNRDGVTPESSGWNGTTWDINEIWRSGSNGVINRGFGVSTPIIVKRPGDSAPKVYAMGWSNSLDHVYCLDADTGQMLWDESYSVVDYGRDTTGNKEYYRGPLATPVMDLTNGYLYTLSCDGDLYCWDTTASSNRAVWNFNLYTRYSGVPQAEREDYGFVASPLLHGSWVIVEVGDNLGNVIAFDKATGVEAWKSANTDDRGWGSPIMMTIDGTPCVAAMTRRNVLVLRTDAGHLGETVTEYPWHVTYSGNIPSPVALNNRLFFAHTDGSSCRAGAIDLTLSGHTSVFDQSSWWWGCSSAVLHKNNLYLVHSRKIRCRALDGSHVWESGETLQDAAYDKFDAASIVVCEGDDKLIIWCGKSEGELRLAEATPSPASYRELAVVTNVVQCSPSYPQHFPGYSHVVVGHGKILCTNLDGDLVCFTIGSGVTVSDATDEGEPCYKIETETATYYFDRTGGGFTSLLDRDGTDWINYQAGGGSAGEYRGIPNTGQLHPGYTGGATTTSDPLDTPLPKVTLETSRAGWGATWVFYPTYAEMTLHTMPVDGNYWILYEGTPGGAVDASDRLNLSNGRDYSCNADHPWGAFRSSPDDYEDITNTSGAAPGSEWVFVAASETNRSLFLAHDDDGIEDDYWQMNNDMTVLGFGRNDATEQLMTAPNARLVIGFVESSDSAVVGNAIHAAWTGGGIMAPTVATLAATDMTSDGARLNGEVLTTGGQAPTVLAYWGDNPGGTIATNWDEVENLGIQGAGGFSRLISDLNDGATYYYRCYVTNSAGGNWAASRTNFATSVDTTPPTIESVTALGSLTSVSVTFSEPVEQASAENSANYAIDHDITVTGASLSPDNRTVTLTMSTLTPGITYTLTVNNVRDRAGTPNTILADSQAEFSFSARVVDGLVVLYEFEEGQGDTVHDVSGVGTALDLAIADTNAVTWFTGGLRVDTATLIASSGAATKLYNALTASNEITVEAWVRPVNTTQLGPARIVSMSVDPFARNFTLGQSAGDYAHRLRTTTAGENGMSPEITTSGGVSTTETAHVVYTRAAGGGATLYVNNAVLGSGTVGGDFSNWDSGQRFGLANELTSDRAWLGELRLVAVYNRALTATEVEDNFNAGPDQPEPDPHCWPQWRGIDRNSRSAETGWLDQWPPPVLWSTNVFRGYAAPAVSEGRCYAAGWSSAGGGRDVVFCFDAADGGLIWSNGYASGSGAGSYGPCATPTVHGNELYTFSAEGRLQCFNKVSGAMLWNKTVTQTAPPEGFCGSPLVEGDLVILSAGASGVAVDRHDPHDIVWSSAGNAGCASPVALNWNGERHVALLSEQGLFGRDPLTGGTNWQYTGLAPHDTAYADPIVHGDRILMTSAGSGFCRLLQLQNGELAPVWTDKDLKADCSTPVLIGDYLYGFHYSSTLTCLDMRNGSVQWSTNISGISEGSLIAAEDRLIVIGGNGTIGIVKAVPSGCDSEGRVFVPIEPGGPVRTWYTHPVLADGRVYCRSEDGLLVCLELRGTPTDGDGDSMGDTWEQRYFGTTELPLADPDGDNDGDGATNKEEHDAGTDPTDANSALRVSISGSGNAVVVRCPTCAYDGIGYNENLTRTYRLEWSTNVVTGPWLDVSGCTNVPGGAGDVCYTNGAPAGPEYYRSGVRVE